MWGWLSSWVRQAYIHFEKHLSPVITPDIQDLLADQGQGPETLGDNTKFTARSTPTTHQS